MNKSVGIICEYNPFHFGHRYHIAEAKKLSGSDTAVCIMSGSMVQRGECAIFDKWCRAKDAIYGGADLVVELPAYYALQSAENFAYGAVRILNEMGVTDSICFGSEHGDISMLEQCAAHAAYPSDEYKEALGAKLDSGSGYPAACEYALRQCIPSLPKNFFSPNNILGMCYISAIKKLSSPMKVYTVKRNNDYHSAESADQYKSASAIRGMIKSGDDYMKYAPDYSGRNIHLLKNAESYILGFFRNVSCDSLCDIKGYEEGLANLITKTAAKSPTVEALFEACVSKRYTLHRIKRFCLCSMLGIRGEHEPEYVRILAAGSKGTEIIREIKKCSKLSVVTKTSDYKGSAMFEMDIAATDLAFLCSEDVSKRICGMDFLRSPVINK